MSNLFLTLVIAFVIIVLALACLAIGWLITGKNKIERGACGRAPGQKKDDDCQSVCNLCSGPLNNDEAERNDETDRVTESKLSDNEKSVDSQDNN